MQKNSNNIVLNYDKYPFINETVLYAEQLNELQENISRVFNKIEVVLNDLKKTDDSFLEKLINYKGDISAGGLCDLEKGSNGDIYTLNDSIENIENLNGLKSTHFSQGDTILCIKNFDIRDSYKDYQIRSYWVKKNRPFEAATEVNSGLITNLLQYFSGLKVFLDGLVVRGSKIDIDASSISIKQDGKIKELPDEGDIKILKDDINFLIKEDLQSIPLQDINNLFIKNP